MLLRKAHDLSSKLANVASTKPGAAIPKQFLEHCDAYAGGCVTCEKHMRGSCLWIRRDERCRDTNADALEGRVVVLVGPRWESLQHCGSIWQVRKRRFEKPRQTTVSRTEIEKDARDGCLDLVHQGRRVITMVKGHPLSTQIALTCEHFSENLLTVHMAT